MEPQIRYARTTDGVNIAYHSLGSGAPFLWPASATAGGLIEQWRVPEFRGIIEEIARRATIVVYDPRGFGLSDRVSQEFTLERAVLDMEAVSDAVAATDPLTLMTFGYLCIPALAYAARHPGRIRALILLNGVARGADMTDAWNRLLRLAQDDWAYATALLARSNEGAYTATSTLEQFEQVLVRKLDRDAFLAFAADMAAWDASAYVASVDAPALVVHYGVNSRYISEDVSRHLAAALPHGSFVSGEVGPQATARLDAVRSAIFSFLRDVSGPRPQRVPEPASSGTAIVLFADIADSTALTERMGDAAFRAKARDLDAALRKVVREQGGNVINAKTLGDGILATFPAASQAIAAALACGRAGEEQGLPLHLGLHAGDVIREEGNVFGGAVNIAARISALSAPGEVLVSDVVRSLARTSAGVAFADRGEHALKGIADPQRVYAVRPGGGG